MNIKKIIKEVVTESDDLSWMDSVSSKPLPHKDRAKVDFTVLFDSLFKEQEETQDNDFFTNLRYFDSEGWVEFNEEEKTYKWLRNPDMEDYDVRDLIEWRFDTPEWEHIDIETVEYELEYSSSVEMSIYKRKSDGRYFGYTYTHNSHDSNSDFEHELTEMFLQTVTKTIWV